MPLFGDMSPTNHLALVRGRAVLFQMMTLFELPDCVEELHCEEQQKYDAKKDDDTPLRFEVRSIRFAHLPLQPCEPSNVRIHRTRVDPCPAEAARAQLRHLHRQLTTGLVHLVLPPRPCPLAAVLLEVGVGAPGHPAKASRAFSKLAAVPAARRPRSMAGEKPQVQPYWSTSVGTPARSSIHPTCRRHRRSRPPTEAASVSACG
jgi:hypothetical protein